MARLPRLRATLGLLFGALMLAACQSSTPQVRTALPAPVPPGAAVTINASAPTSFAQIAPILGEAEARARATLVIDATTGRVLFEDNADALRFPASLTKLMTLQLIFDAIERGQISMMTPLTVTENAASQPPSKLGVKAGSSLRVRDAVAALSIKSANDVAVVVAENLAGSEEAFVARMNARARQLGMRRTRFVNAHGLPDTRQVSTARDIAILARNIRLRHPQYARYFRATAINYEGRKLKATNKLIGNVAGVDGMKTGYVRMSGYNLVTTARRGARNIIIVYFGGRTGRARDAEVTTLVQRYL
ncbi:MAG: D-alanyl-D-alanine carboxypeptidase family protein [Pseudomonadota bacterium]